MSQTRRTSLRRCGHGSDARRRTLTRAAALPRSCWCSRTCASTRRRPRTTPATRRSWPRAPTSTLTTRSAPRTARTRPPRVRRPARPSSPRLRRAACRSRRRHVGGPAPRGRGAVSPSGAWLARAQAARLRSPCASASWPHAPAVLITQAAGVAWHAWRCARRRRCRTLTLACNLSLPAQA